MTLVTDKNISFRELFTLNIDSQYQLIKILKQLSDTIDMEGEYTIKERINNLNKYLIENGHHRIFAIYYKSDLVGAITVLIEPKIIHNFKNVCHIEDFVIDKKYRGIGIGRIVLEKIKTLAQTYECYKIILDCKDSVISFYNNCGYVKANNQMALYLDL
jgi:glucosamine-phosphate N-acetyltransferase